MIFPEKHPDRTAAIYEKIQGQIQAKKKKRKKKGARRRKTPIQPSADDSAPWKYIYV